METEKWRKKWTKLIREGTLISVRKIEGCYGMTDIDRRVGFTPEESARKWIKMLKEKSYVNKSGG